MTDTFLKEHMAGKHEAEIISLMEKIDQCLHGHSRLIVLLTLTRLMAVMLGPATPETRKATLEEIPKTIGNVLAEMDRMMDQTMRDAAANEKH